MPTVIHHRARGLRGDYDGMHDYLDTAGADADFWPPCAETGGTRHSEGFFPSGWVVHALPRRAWSAITTPTGKNAIIFRTRLDSAVRASHDTTPGGSCRCAAGCAVVFGRPAR